MKEISKHNYTNPAFCQQSEFYPTNNTNVLIRNNKNISPVKVHRSESSRSFVHIKQQQQVQQQRTTLVRNRIGNSNNQLLNVTLPPKPGPKPSNYGELQRNNQTSGSGRYALVPVEDLPKDNNGRYAVLPITSSISSLVKSQHNLDRYASLPIQEDEPLSLDSSRYSSLPPISPSSIEPPRLNHAFSSDFGSKSLVVVDQKSMQRYEIVPTDDDEELVDDNHEIIQIHNGRPHRYAMIPTEEEQEDEEETCLSNDGFEIITTTNHNYATIKDNRNFKINNNNCNSVSNNNSPQRLQNSIRKISTPQKLIYSSTTALQQQQQQLNQGTPPPATPTKSKNLATQKLHELLSTPTKKIQQSQQATPKTKEQQYQLNQLQFTPQKLQYDPQQQLQLQQIHQQQQTLNQHHHQLQLENRTTAIITPRLASLASSNIPGSIYSETTSESQHNKSWNNISFQKISAATLSVAIVSFMLIICGILNTGLTIYLIYNHGKSLFMEFALTSGIATTALGVQGFRTRNYASTPNRNYISGHILVTIFSLLKCCCLLLLLTMEPFPGSPLHDVTSGVILGLSTLTILLISLGIIITKWCHSPPPDNRVDLY